MIFYSWWRMSALEVYDYQPPSMSRAGDMEVAGADQNICIERTLLLSWHLLWYCIAAGPCFLRNDGARMAAQNSYSLPIRQYF